jgi:hypothetical protein
MKLHKARIAVLGAGIQGSCVALELAARDARIDLFERNSTCLAETSTNNEGKVHLGYVYAYDKSFKTAQMMIEGALCFERLLRRWIGDSFDSLPFSSPFQYLVHRDGLMTETEFEAHATRVNDFIAEKYNSVASPYFGRDLRQPFRRIPQSIAQADRHIVAGFQTEEIGVDPEALCTLVRHRLKHASNINCLTGHSVSKVYNDSASMAVEYLQGNQQGIQHYDYVINTLGSNRLRIDAQIGVHAPRPWAYRLKYFLRANSSNNLVLKSTTIVLGPFGDIVNYRNGIFYLSWYPSGMTEWSNSISPPDRPLSLEGIDQKAMVKNILLGLSSVVPEISSAGIKDIIVNGGWIYSLGETDIDDPGSGFHERFDVGVERSGRYLTIDTGKLTLAPMFAERAANMLEDLD